MSLKCLGAASLVVASCSLALLIQTGAERSQPAFLVSTQQYGAFFGNNACPHWRRGNSFSGSHGKRQLEECGSERATMTRRRMEQDERQGEKTDLYQKSEEINQIYASPALYDLAFSYRNYEQEVEFLLYAHQRHASFSSTTSGDLRILELAAGPARHVLTALEMYQEEVTLATAVDNCPEMVQYGRNLAKQEFSSVPTDNFWYIEADMRYLSEANDTAALAPATYDTIWLVLGSFQHMLTLSDALSCLRSAARLLRKGGTMILELPHPREAVFGMTQSTSESWLVESEDKSRELHVIWGRETDPLNVRSQVRQFTVEMTMRDTAHGDGNEKHIRQVVPTRIYTAQEMEALVQLAGNFSLVAIYGALEFQEPQLDDNDEDEEAAAAAEMEESVVFRQLSPISMEDESEAYRMVCVLRKEGGQSNAFAKG